jgi:hypothetical protein
MVRYGAMRLPIILNAPRNGREWLVVLALVEQMEEFVFGELEFLEIDAQGPFIQIVSGVRLPEGNGVRVSRWIEEISC